MRIEEGKYYRTRDGRKVGPAKKQFEGRFDFDGDHSYCHAPDGKYLGSDSSLDIVAEWTDAGPIRTVTRQEIIPGTYDGVRVGDVSGGYVTIPGLTQTAWSADELERAAAVLTALAGALRDGE